MFFVSTGAGLDIDALFRSSRAIILVPVFLAALLVVRGLPALLYVRAVGRAHALAAGFMQATSLTFIVVATIIGVETNHQRSSTATALVVAGLLSIIIYPPIALQLLKSGVDGQESRLPAHLAAPAQPAAARTHRDASWRGHRPASGQRRPRWRQGMRREPLA